MAYDDFKVLATTGLKQDTPIFMPSEQERDLVLQVYNDFIYDYSIKNQGWDVLNNRTLEKYWQDSNYDYNQSVVEDTNNPVVQYSSGISRDKANTLILNLTQDLQYPSVTALNTQQEIDTTISMIAKPILKWQFTNDGRPSESGRSKNYRYTHKQVVEGTVHILDTVKADGRLESSLIPNEEVFIPNFFQPDVQKQSHFFAVKQWASFAEAEAEFGECDNFKYVTPGSLGWISQTYAYKEKYKALVYNNQCTIIRAWYPVRAQQLEKFKKQGRLPKWVQKAKYFNTIINGIPMFPWNNLMPYYHGDYPITKAVFENFSPAEFYWGNSMPNKIRQDKQFLDGWKTLMRYKAKLSAIPPLLNFTGTPIENDIIIPGLITDLPANLEPNKISDVPGISNGVTAGDAQILTETTSDIERATVAPMTGGQFSGQHETARQAMLVEQNAQKILMGLAQQLAFREEARAFPILKSSFQFLTRQKIKKLSIPDETFGDGTSGNLEIIFQKLPAMTDEQRLTESYKVRAQEEKAKKQGKNLKQVYVDPEYIQQIDLYCEAIAENFVNQNQAWRETRAEHKWQIYSQFPQLFNQKLAARKLASELGDNPHEMILEDQPGQTPGMGQPAGIPAQAPASAMPGASPFGANPVAAMRQGAGQQMQNLSLQHL